MKTKYWLITLMTIFGTMIAQTVVAQNEINTSTIRAYVTVRYQDQILFSDLLLMPTSTEFNYQADGETKTSTTGITALGALVQADTLSDSFNIANIDYYSWGGYLVKCLQVTDVESPACNNWQYAVEGNYPAVGMDSYNLSNNENIYFYFGDRQKITTDKNEYIVGETVTGTIWEYDYTENIYRPLAEQKLALLNTLDSPLITGFSDSNGQMVATTSASGTYRFGLEVTSEWGNYYWPKSSDFTIIDATSTQNSTSTNNTGGGGSGSVHHKINVPSALAFLDTKQTNGDFGSNLLTDWAAIAYSAYGDYPTKNKVQNYLTTHTNVDGGLNNTSDNARRALALMALGINPYNGTGINYINNIVKTFDGRQFGESGLYNDDIFALMTLVKAGYSTSDPMIVSTTKFIISKQLNDGSFGDVDMTAAAIQALDLVKNIDGTNEAMEKSKAYLNSKQNSDGSFTGATKSISTAWAGLAQRTVGTETTLANDFLYYKQMADGGLENIDTDEFTRTWATIYAIPVALDKNWNDIINNFNLPEENGSTGGNNANPETNITTTTISTTTTEAVATSTFTPTTTINLNIPTSTFITANYSSSTIITNTTTTITPSLRPILRKKLIKITTSTTELTLPHFNTTTLNNTDEIVNNLPLDTPTKRNLKTILGLSGGSAFLIALLLGLKLWRDVV